jgi:phage gpG-like protein
MSELGAVLGQLKQERSRVAAELRQLDQAIQALSKVAGGTPGAGRRVKRTMSIAARKRIAAAQRARWAKFHASRKKAA